MLSLFFLLAYRLLHFNDRIPDIKLNIKGREKQLFKPVIRVFQNTETLKELLPVISNYVTQKREANDATFNAFLYRAIIDLIAAHKTATLPSRLIWDFIISNLEATVIAGRNLSCETTEFGILSQKEITQTLKHVFGAKSKKIEGNMHLVFDLGKLQRLGKVYNLSIQVEVLEDSSGTRHGEDRDDREDIGTDKAIFSAFQGPENEEIERENRKEIPAKEENNEGVDSQHPPDPPDRPRIEDGDGDSFCNEDGTPLSEEEKAEARAKYDATVRRIKLK